MSFDPKINRNNKDAIGDPGDTAATDSTNPWTQVSLLKGLYALLTTGNTAGATAAKQDTGNVSLASIDTKITTLSGFVDGLEALATAQNGFVDGLEALAAAATPAGEAHTGQVGGTSVIVSASSTIIRPGDTTAYASGDLVANSVTAGSVNALQFTTAARISTGSGAVLGARIQKSTNTSTNAAFRLHLFDTTPTFTSAGDNSAMTTVVVASAKGYLGYVDIAAMTGFSDVAWGVGAPDAPRTRLLFKATAQTLFGIIEARGAYAPGNAEVFTIAIMVDQN